MSARDETAPPRLPVGGRLVVTPSSDGSILLHSSIPLGDAGREDVLDRLDTWASRDGAAPFLSEPQGDDRAVLTYGEAALGARRVARLLADRGHSPGDAVLSRLPAGIAAALLKLGCLAGGFIHVAEPRRADDALQVDACLSGCRILRAAAAEADIDVDEIFDAATRGPASARRDADPGEIAEIYFTSGSTGAAKAVAITRAMIASNQSAIAAAWPFIAARRPVLVDWLPWRHVFGGLDNFYKMLWNGGVVHVDAPPSDATIGTTLALLRRYRPTLHIAVPAGLPPLLSALERDPETDAAFASNLDAIFFAGAGADPALVARLFAFRDAHHADGSGDFMILSGYGATETGSTLCLSQAPLESAGELGAPLPGHLVKLAPVDGTLEIRARGPNLFPGYLTPQGFAPRTCDSDGFFPIGDAGILRERRDGQQVLVFDGRLAEDFKLANGTRVRAGALRAALRAHLAPLVDDVIVAGENRDRLALILFPDDACGDDVEQEIARRIEAWNAENPAPSSRIAIVVRSSMAPSAERGEFSEKGQVVASRYLRNQSGFIEALYADGADGTNV